MLLPPIGSLIAGKYRLESLLGEGGMGAVFRARHELMDKQVAVKWLKPTSGDEAAARHRFVQEARAAARIRHPNVVDVYDVGEQDSCLFMVMELLEGQTFADYLEQKGMAVAEALRHLLAAMRGVAAAHAAGITHRDIKPENIFIAADPLHVQGVAKILDFGISKLHDEPQPTLTLAGTTMGTPHYMSYEQIRCMSDVDHRTDIYAFGVLLYQAVTGALPYDGDTLPGIIMQAATGRAVRPVALCPDLPPELDELIMKAIALRREDRFQSIDAMINALTRVHLARHSWSSSTERPSWAPGSLPVAAPVLRARALRFGRGAAEGASRQQARSSQGPAERHAGASSRDAGHSQTTIEVVRSLVPALGLRVPAFLRARTQGAGPPARPNFTPVNPWLGLAGAALGVVMGGALYTRLMTPTPSRAGKASASALAQPEAESVNPMASRPDPSSSLLADTAPSPLLPVPSLPSGKEPPFSFATSAGLDEGSASADEPAGPPSVVTAESGTPPSLARGPEGALRATTSSVKPPKPASSLAGDATPAVVRSRAEDPQASTGVRPQAASPQTTGEKPAGASSERQGESQPVSPAAPVAASPVAHHRSGPLKLEDL